MSGSLAEAERLPQSRSEATGPHQGWADAEQDGAGFQVCLETEWTLMWSSRRRGAKVPPRW